MSRRVRRELAPLESLPDELLVRIFGSLVAEVTDFEQFRRLWRISPLISRVFQRAEVLHQLRLLQIFRHQNLWPQRLPNPNYESEGLLALAGTDGRGGIASYFRGIHWLVEALGAFEGAEEMIARGVGLMEHSFFYDSESCVMHKETALQLLWLIWVNRSPIVPEVVWRLHHRFTVGWQSCHDPGCGRRNCEHRRIPFDEVDELERTYFCSECAGSSCR